jgi:adenylate cyclase class 2
LLRARFAPKGDEMKTELEVKFANISIEAIRAALRAAGAVCQQPMRLMKRALIEESYHEADKSFIRIRDEGDKITLTFKRRATLDATTIDSVKELEVEVSDFNKTVQIFSEAGWQYKTFQESKRETWKLGSTEIVVDEWPWLKPYIEIEGESEAAIKAAAQTLGLDWGDACFGNIDELYKMEYEFQNGTRGVIDVAEVRFGDSIPQEFKPRQEHKK